MRVHQFVDRRNHGKIRGSCHDVDVDVQEFLQFLHSRNKTFLADELPVKGGIQMKGTVDFAVHPRGQ